MLKYGQLRDEESSHFLEAILGRLATHPLLIFLRQYAADMP
jgi:hypothetical protein